MMHRLLALALCIGVCWGVAGDCRAQSPANPFTIPSTAPVSPDAMAQKPAGGFVVPGFVSRAISTMTQWQLTMRNAMASKADDILTHPYGRSFWLFIGFAFAYGFIHAMGPGHGKVFAAGYFLHRPDGIWLGLLFGFLTMGFHVLSATILVMAGFWLLGGTAALSGGGGVYLEPVSYGLVVCLGVFMTVDTLREMFFFPKKAGCIEYDGEIGSRQNGRSRLWAMTMAAGLVPCPGAAMVLVFSITLGIAHAGYAAMFAISAGMGLALSFVSVGTVLFRGVLLAATGRHEKMYHVLHRTMSLAGSLIVMLFGAMMFLGSLRLG